MISYSRIFNFGRSASRLLCALLFVSAAGALQAHSVWIEPAEESLVIRFAEPGNKLETSPGFLDHLSAPLAVIAAAGKPAPLVVTKKADHFLLEGAAPENVACVETTFTVRGGRKPYFYARWQLTLEAEAPPLLTLDLTPTGRPGEVRAWFRGQPLPNAEATLRSPDGEESDLTADANGYLHFDSPQKPGQYLLTIAHHREALGGFHLGVAYQETSHNCSLVWRVAAAAP